MTPSFDANRLKEAKKSAGIKEAVDNLTIAEASLDPDSAASKIKQLKIQMAEYIEDNTDYLSDSSLKELRKKRIQYQLDYLFSLPSIYHYSINPENDLNTAIWKSITNVLKPSLPEKFKISLGK